MFDQIITVDSQHPVLSVASHASRKFYKLLQNSFKDKEYSLECVKYVLVGFVTRGVLGLQKKNNE